MATNEFLYLDKDDVVEEKEEEDSESDEANEGYDYAFVDPGHSDAQRCPICHLMAKTFVKLTAVERSSVKIVLRNTSNTLMNSNVLIFVRGLVRDTSKIQESHGIEREILQLQIYCTNKSEGCSWQGNLKYIDTHIKKCSNQVIKCLYMI